MFYLSVNLRFLDTTLRDGEQTPGVSLNPDQKFEIATRLSDIGVDVIEAGSAAASDGEREAITVIADAGLSAEICTFVRALHAGHRSMPPTAAPTRSTSSSRSATCISQRRCARPAKRSPQWRGCGGVCEEPGAHRGTLGRRCVPGRPGFPAGHLFRRGGTRGRPALFLRYGRAS